MRNLPLPPGPEQRRHAMPERPHLPQDGTSVPDHSVTHPEHTGAGDASWAPPREVHIVRPADSAHVRPQALSSREVPSDTPQKAPLDPQLVAEIRQAVAGAEWYDKKAGSVHYGTIKTAYAASVTIVDGRTLTQDENGLWRPTDETEILIAQRGLAGDATADVWTGISGYIDTPYNPHDPNDVTFDPVAHTAYKELQEECNMAPSDAPAIDLRIGQRFSEPRKNGGTVHIIPLAGVTTGEALPALEPDGTEVRAIAWRPLGSIATRPPGTLSPGYLEHTLPGVLAAFDMDPVEVQRLLRER